MFEYLVNKCGLDINAKSKTGDNIISISLRMLKTKDNNLWVEYLLKNYQIKVDKSFLNTISDIFKK